MEDIMFYIVAWDNDFNEWVETYVTSLSIANHAFGLHNYCFEYIEV